MTRITLEAEPFTGTVDEIPGLPVFSFQRCESLSVEKVD